MQLSMKIWSNVLFGEETFIGCMPLLCPLQRGVSNETYLISPVHNTVGTQDKIDAHNVGRIQDTTEGSKQLKWNCKTSWFEDTKNI